LGTVLGMCLFWKPECDWIRFLRDFKLLSSRAITAHTAFHLLLNMPITFTASSSMTFLSDIEDNNSRALSFLSSIRVPLLSFFPKSLWQESVVDLTSLLLTSPDRARSRDPRQKASSGALPRRRRASAVSAKPVIIQVIIYDSRNFDFPGSDSSEKEED